MVEAANGAPPGYCCQQYNQACVIGGSLQQIQGLITMFGGNYSHLAPPAHPMALYNTLASGRPVILQIKPGAMNAGPGAMAHVVVVRGMTWVYTPTGPQALLHLNDPMNIYTVPVPFMHIAPIWSAAIVVD